MEEQLGAIREDHSDVRHYTNKLLELMDTMVVDPKWLAMSLMNYMSEDQVADFARSEEYFDVDEIESEYSTRRATNLMIDLMDEGLADPKVVVKGLVNYMSEDNVEDFCKDYELIDGEDDDESVEESTVLKDEEDNDTEIKQWKVPNPLGIETIFIGTEKAAKALCAKYGLTPEEVK